MVLGNGTLPTSSHRVGVSGCGGAGAWHNMALWARGNLVSANFDCSSLVSDLRANGPTHGGVAVGTGWHMGYIDDLEIVSLHQLHVVE